MSKEQVKNDKVIEIQKCFDLSHEVQKASILLKCSPEEIDFEICEVFTFVKEDQNHRELSSQESKELFVSGLYESETFEVEQAFRVKMWKSQKEWDFDLELSMQNAHLLLVCQEDWHKRLLEDLEQTYRKINAKKALLGVIFKDFSPIFDDRKKFHKMLQEIYDGIDGVYKILLETSSFYIPAFDTYFAFKLREEWEFRHRQTLENSLYAIKDGEEVGKLIYGHSGSSGRDLLGEYIRVEKRELQACEFGALAEDFDHYESKGRLIYRALKDGFVGLNGSGLILIKDFMFEEINYRNIGNLLGGIEKELEIEIKSSSLEKDAIGAGIVLEAKKIKVYGGIDQGAILKAKECLIEGLTHQGVEVIADYAEISTHKGNLRAKKAIVKLCEGGVIDCESGEFEDLIGSKISCKEAVVKNCRANNHISFCTQLRIDCVLGGDNKFKIDSSAFFEYREEIETILDKYHKQMTFIDHALQIYQKEFKKVLKMKQAIERFEVIVAKNASQGLSTQSYITDTIQQYTQMQDKLKSIKEKIQAHQQKAQMTKVRLEPIANLCIEAKLFCQSDWIGQNHVEYFDSFHETTSALEIDEGERVNVFIDLYTHKLRKERVSQ